jgi:hypothetical protein
VAACKELGTESSGSRHGRAQISHVAGEQGERGEGRPDGATSMAERNRELRPGARGKAPGKNDAMGGLRQGGAPRGPNFLHFDPSSEKKSRLDPRKF